MDRLWNLNNRQPAPASGAESESQSVERRLAELEARLDSLTLACMAMWRLIQRKHGISDDEFSAMVREVDLSDGRLDGRIAPETKSCATCGRAMSSRHVKCLYCGGDNLQRKPFEGAR